MRQRLLIWLRAILIGWSALLLFAFVVARPLLRVTAPLVGSQWIATLTLGLDCATMAGTGWVVGRLSRPSSISGVLSFALTLTLWDLSPIVDINVPWLVRLAGFILKGESANLSSFTNQALLFACLIAGGLLGRPPAKPVSISDRS